MSGCAGDALQHWVVGATYSVGVGCRQAGARSSGISVPLTSVSRTAERSAGINTCWTGPVAPSLSVVEGVTPRRVGCELRSPSSPLTLRRAISRTSDDLMTRPSQSSLAAPQVCGLRSQNGGSGSRPGSCGRSMLVGTMARAISARMRNRNTGTLLLSQLSKGRSPTRPRLSRSLFSNYE